jgi:hypothetical protein
MKDFFCLDIGYKRGIKSNQAEIDVMQLFRGKVKELMKL